MFKRVLENEARNARPSAQRSAQFNASFLEVRMFHVGHGEAILIVFPGNRAWLVDGGSSNGPRLNRELGERLVAYFEERGLVLEAFVPSHPHIDHAGAVATVLDLGAARLSSEVTIYRSDDRTWELDRDWLNELRSKIDALGTRAHEEVLRDAHREVSIGADSEAHLFAGSGEGAYTSVFFHLHFREARLVFTGDSHCSYERELLDTYGEGDFRADVLKVSHHGSSSGTAKTVLDAVRPGIAIASTDDDPGHTLERDTLQRLGGRPGPRAVFETVVDGDITVRTDGREYRGGILYDIQLKRPGRFAAALEAHRLALSDIKRTSSPYPDCD